MSDKADRGALLKRAEALLLRRCFRRWLGSWMNWRQFKSS
jgi:hypothetical protein